MSSSSSSPPPCSSIFILHPPSAHAQTRSASLTLSGPSYVHLQLVLSLIKHLDHREWDQNLQLGLTPPSVMTSLNESHVVPVVLSKGGKWFHYNNQTQPRWSDVLCCWFAGRESSGRSGLRHRTVSSWRGSWTHVSHSLTTERHVCFKSHGNHLRRSKSRKRSHSQITPMQFCFYSNDHNSRRFIL